MRHPFVHLSSNKRLGLLITVVVAAAVMIAALVYLTGHGRTAKAAEASPANPQNVVSETVQLADSPEQTRAITRVWQKFKTGQ